MSLYTNDTDTLRQWINQSLPQVLMSALTIVVTFIAMLVLSPILTVLAVDDDRSDDSCFKNCRRKQRKIFRAAAVTWQILQDL